jgi:tetratricopeptide (TPR) repeat protein
VARQRRRTRSRRNRNPGHGSDQSRAAQEGLRVLHDAWAETVRERRPRVVVLLGGTGRGKTWSVQRFYDEISTGARYWRPGLEHHDIDNLPDLDSQRKRVVYWDVEGSEVPEWLWLGVNCRPARGLSDAASAELAASLATNLSILRAPSRWAVAREEARKVGFDVSTGELLPILGRALLVGRALRGLWAALSAFREADGARDDESRLLSAVRNETRRAVRECGRLMLGREVVPPTVLVLDDAHYASREVLSQAAALLTDHDRREGESRYFNAGQAPAPVPALIVLTIWPHTLSANDEYATELVRWLDELDSSGVELVVVDRFPGLNTVAAAQIAEDVVPHLDAEVREALIDPITVDRYVNPLVLQFRLARVASAFRPDVPIGSVDQVALRSFIDVLPRSPVDVFRAQLATLQANVRFVLALGGQLGVAFPIGAVVASAPFREGDVGDFLQIAVEQGFLEVDEDVDVPVFTRYIFTDEIAPLYFVDESMTGGEYQRSAQWLTDGLLPFAREAIPAYALAPASGASSARRRSVLRQVGTRFDVHSRAPVAHLALSCLGVDDVDVDEIDSASSLLDETQDHPLDVTAVLLVAASRLDPDVRDGCAPQVGHHFSRLVRDAAGCQLAVDLAVDSHYYRFLDVDSLHQVALETQHPDVIHRWVDRLCDDSSFDDVLTVARPLLPFSEQAVLRLSRASGIQSDDRRVMRFLDNYLRDESLTLATKWARLALANGEDELLVARGETIAARNPNVALYVAQALGRLNRADEAIALLASFPQHARAVRMRARICLELGRLGAAREVLLPFGGSDTELGRLYEKVCETDDASEALTLVRLHREVPANAVHVNSVVDELSQLGRRDEAVQFLLEAGTIQARLRAVNLLADDPKAGIALLEAHRGVHPHAALVLARLYERVGRSDDAFTTLEQWHMADSQAATRYASMLKQRGRAEEAEAVLRRFAESDPHAAVALARLLDEQGRVDEVADLCRGTRMDDLIVYRARSLLLSGAVSEAREFVASSVRSRADFRPSARVSARLRARAARLPVSEGRGSPSADSAYARECAELLLRIGDSEGASELLERYGLPHPRQPAAKRERRSNASANFGSEAAAAQAAVAQAKMLERRGDRLGALDLLRPFDENIQATLLASQLLIDTGDEDEALRRLYRVANAEDTAAVRLAALLVQRSDIAEAERVLRGALHVDFSGQVTIALATLLADDGRLDEGQDLLVPRAAFDKMIAARLSRLLLASGMYERLIALAAEGLLHEEVVVEAARELIKLRQLATAHDLLRATGRTSGPTAALLEEVRVMQSGGDVVREAERLWSEGQFQVSISLLRSAEASNVKAIADLSEMLALDESGPAAIETLLARLREHPSLEHNLAELAIIHRCWDLVRPDLEELARSNYDAVFLLALGEGLAEIGERAATRLRAVEPPPPRWTWKIAEQLSGSDRSSRSTIAAAESCDASGFQLLAEKLLRPLTPGDTTATFLLSTKLRRRFEFVESVTVLGGRESDKASLALCAALAGYLSGDGEVAEQALVHCRYPTRVVRKLQGGMKPALSDPSVAVATAALLETEGNPLAAYDVLYPHRGGGDETVESRLRVLGQVVTKRQRMTIARLRARALLGASWAAAMGEDHALLMSRAWTNGRLGTGPSATLETRRQNPT